MKSQLIGIYTSFFLETRTAFRRLRKSPVFTLTTIIILALGIGATAAIWSVVNAVLISPLPFPNSDRIVGVWHIAPKIDEGQFAHAHISYLFYRTNNQVFEDVGLYQRSTASITGIPPEELQSAEVTASAFNVLRVSPQLGRYFTESEEDPGTDPVVILSHKLWIRRFGGDLQIIGKKMDIDGIARTIVGVMPPEFSFPETDTNLWLPMKINRTEPNRSRWGNSVIARLKPGIDLAIAQAEMSSRAKNLHQVYPSPEESAKAFDEMGLDIVISPYHEDVVGSVSDILWILLGGVGVILFVAGANVANLFMTRSEGRNLEFAVRSALGESVVRQYYSHLTESMLIALAGGGLGLLFTTIGIDIFLALSPSTIPRLDEIGINNTVIIFALAISVLAGLLLGLPHILRRTSYPSTILGGMGRQSTAGPDRHRVRSLLVVVQLSLALILMTGSGLVVRSFAQLRDIDPGCESEGILTLRLPLSESRYPSREIAVAFYEDVLNRIRALPGVQEAGGITGLPLTGNGTLAGHTFEDFPLTDTEFVPNYRTHLVMPGYFKSMGIPLITGRFFSNQDLHENSKPVLINFSFANRLWPSESAIGKRLTPARSTDTSVWHTIVGVVGDVHSESLELGPTEMIYYPFGPITFGSTNQELFERSLNLTVQTNLSPTSLTKSISDAIWEIDSNLPITNIQTMDEVVGRASARTSFVMILLLIASGLALMIGVTGLFGVISYLVSLRIHEFGIRMALGADSSRVSRMVVGQGLTLTSIGLGLGLGVSFFVTRYFESLLFGVKTTDPFTFFAVSLVLFGVATLASYIPAKRAASLNPLEALRYE